MTIQEAIQAADRLYENTVPKEQKIQWCDELGALLKNEYAKTYREYEAVHNGEAFLIPRAVFRQAAAWKADGQEITKQALLRDGWIWIPDGENVRLTAKSTARPIGKVTVIYQTEYAPVTDPFTDGTVCGAPYDRMYIDFIIAKCNYYNRDFAGYNQHMTYFNSLLTGFGEDFIRKNEPLRREIGGWY